MIDFSGRFGRALFFAVACVGLAQGGCAFSARVDSPDPGDIIGYVSDFEKHFGRKIDTGEDYVLAGLSYVDHYCELFFTELEVEKRKLAFSKSSIQQGFATAITIAPLTTATNKSKPVAILGALSGLANHVFEQYEKQFVFASYSAQLRLKVLQAQYNFKEVHKQEISSLNTSLRDASLATVYKSHQVVQEYAKLCTIPQLDLYIITALDATAAGNQQSRFSKCVLECDQGAFDTKLFGQCVDKCMRGTPKAKSYVYYRASSGKGSTSPATFSSPPFVSQAR